MFKKTSLWLFESAIQAALGLDPRSPERLQRVSGKLLQITLLPFELHLWLLFSETGVQLLAHTETPANAVIRSHPIDLVRLGMTPASRARTLFQQGVLLEGDVQFASDVKRLFDGLEVDWEAHLARCIGDVAAYQTMKGVRTIRSGLQQLGQSLAFQVSNYCHTEGQVSPPARAVRDFFDEVDELALRVERLAAKVGHGV